MHSQSNRVVTRIAPSPTGLLHVGTARTALFNYLFARKHGGTFLLRIEDTDRNRSREEYEANILDGLRWLGLWPSSQGPSLRQSERTARYRQLLEQLIEEGKAYLSREESKQHPGSMVEVVRLRNPGGTVTFSDLIRGTVTMEVDSLGDLVLARSLDAPVYHFAVVVDDADMGVTHIIRGEDHIANTPRQILIQEALGVPRPQYAHLPLLLAPDRSKLSKRHGAVAVSEYRTKGYLPEAIINYLALLGWNPGTEQELFGVWEREGEEYTSLELVLEDLTAVFSLEGVQKGGAMFSLEKLRWFNAQHLRRKDRAFQLAYIAEALQPYEGKNGILRAISAAPSALADFLGRVSVGEEILEKAREGEWRYYEQPPVAFPEYVEDPHALLQLLLQRVQPTSCEDSPLPLAVRLLSAAQSFLAKEQTWDAFHLEERIRSIFIPDILGSLPLKNAGSILWPLRVALSGKARSPSPFVLMEALGKEETLRRLTQAIDLLQAAHSEP